MLPSASMTPQEVDAFLLALPRASPLRSLMIRFPRLTLDDDDERSNELLRGFAGLEELRELWLAEGPLSLGPNGAWSHWTAGRRLISPFELLAIFVTGILDETTYWSVFPV